ncbi:helix-turn-helix domain-containing protein [Paenibacillus sp. YYML68]|uniref:helix-turn-helix domain-containing protein n=1 Tax=Paenibacillus sp. YYML68 TaxID=2909250 RepID=UPI002491681E|nr:helix-turn-helix transcriptional regulator [Paenibacillus sp. YYML68]
MSQLGEKIRTQRIKRNWTQDFLAQKVGTSKHVMSNWERGVANPDHKQIALIANAFSVSADYLIGITDIPEPYYKDPFGQSFLFPHVNYSFVQENTWDLLKLIDSGIELTVDNIILTNKDKTFLVLLISTVMSRTHEVAHDAENLIKKELTDDFSSDGSLF